MGRVVLTLTASGSVSDYSDNDKAKLRRKVADVARVDESLVTIRVAAASVLFIATIVVPASMTADEVQTSLSSTLSTADAASTALGVTVEKVPTTTVALAEPPSTPPPSPPSPKPLAPPNTEDESAGVAMEIIVLAIAGGAAVFLSLSYLARKAVLKKRVERREKISPQLSTVGIVARNAAPAATEIVAGNTTQDQRNHARVQATVARVRREQELRAARTSTVRAPGSGTSAQAVLPAPATDEESTESESELDRV